MKIIGHRGAAGLAPENTIKAVQAGIAAGADAVEFDVRLTKDGVFVLSHDSTLLRVAGVSELVRNLTHEQIRVVKTLDGEPIPTLDEALAVRGEATAIIEGKGSGWAKPLAEYLLKNNVTNFCVIAFNHAELGILHELMPEAKCYALERQNAFKTIGTAHRLGLYGVDLNFWILNPFTYWFARFNRIELATYTIDTPGLMRWFACMYPRVAITTNRPDILNKIKK
ncbi:MAG: putative Glycerophosphoryl diester phosphodiesterase [Candidatus Saccharibacteria bacterium]|nr:putative Glycerophosphoryl diester phosphodiesterase [Candidatus Saccharibacteria bacterium]